MKTAARLRELAGRIDARLPAGTGILAEESAGLVLLRETSPTQFEATIYEPLVCLILQGEKVTTVGTHSLTITQGQCIIVSHDLPVLSRITRASKRAPYLALVVRLDLNLLRGVYDELGATLPSIESSGSIEMAPADEHVVQVLERYLELLDEPTAARVLLPLVRKELHFRLFMSRSGGMLRSLLRRDSHAGNIGRAIEILRKGFRDPLEVQELAKTVGMSVSSFHKHFKSVTHTTPVQYQKDLRLTEARRLLRGGQHTVSSAAFEVGYESSSQFSREYSRKFQAPPRAHVGVS